jgi:hypothetical protein
LFELPEDKCFRNVAVELLVALRVQADHVPSGRIEREGWEPHSADAPWLAMS